jgi:hypothetical protein
MYHRTSRTLAAIAGSFLVFAATGCGAGTAINPGNIVEADTHADGASTLAVKVVDSDNGGIVAVRVTVYPAGTLVAAAEQTVYLQEADLPEYLWATDSSPHRQFADTYFTLDPGAYDVVVTPIGEDATSLVEQGTCMLARRDGIQVRSGVTTEVVLTVTCGEEDSGGLDAVVVVNHKPHIDGLTFAPSKFVDVCEPLRITASASDSDGDALQYWWFATGPDGTRYWIDDHGRTVKFQATDPGQYEATVVVCDVVDPEQTERCVSLSFPIHVLASDDALCPADDAGMRRASVVVGSVPLVAGDAEVVGRLRTLGFHARVVPDALVDQTIARSSDVVVVTGSVSPEVLGDAFLNVDIPVLVAHPGLFDEMGMTSAGWNENLGVSQESTHLDVDIQQRGHPLAAGFSGPVPVTTAPMQFGWGLPGPGADIVATVAGLPAIFVYEHGVAMRAEVTAPARRIGWFAGDAATHVMTRAGWAMFDAAVLGTSHRDIAAYNRCAGIPADTLETASMALPATEVFAPVLPGVQIVGDQADSGAVRFSTPRVLEVPGELSIPNEAVVQTIAITFQEPTCVRSGGMTADVWYVMDTHEIACSYSLAFASETTTTFRLDTCSGGVAAQDQLLVSGVRIAPSPTPLDGAPLNISVPGAGGGILEEPVDAETTERLLGTFSWDSTAAVAETDSEGRPATWYTMIYLRSSADRQELDELQIKYDTLPLFRSELERWRGQRGFFLHQGDGHGFFVFALVPGATYNAIRERGLSGDGLFQAVYLREVPEWVRAPNGSVSPDLPAGRANTQDASPGTSYRATATRRSTEGPLELTVVTHLRSTDPLFGGVLPASPWAPDTSRPMVRPWGEHAGEDVALDNLEVRACVTNPDWDERMWCFYATTNAGGVAVFPDLPVFDGSSIALRIKMAGRGGELHGAEYVDLSGPFSSLPGRLTYHTTLQHGYFNLLAQLNEGHAYAEEILGVDPKPARVTVGWLARAMADKGFDNMFAPCAGLNSGLISDALGALPTEEEVNEWAQEHIHEDIPEAVSRVLAAVVDYFLELVAASVDTDFDIYVPTGPESSQVKSRGVMSHEYGHYVLCSVLKRAGLLRLVYSQMTESRLNPFRRPQAPADINEGFADFLAAQLVGGTNYFEPGDPQDYFDTYSSNAMMYCHTGRGQCMETNDNTPTTSDESKARYARLLHDVFDAGSPGPLHTGQVWQAVGPVGDEMLFYDPMGTNVALDPDESISVPLSRMAEFITYATGPEYCTADLCTILSGRSFMTRLDAFLAADSSWCERCRLYAIHEDLSRVDDPSGVMNNFCAQSTRIMSWMPPPPDPTNPASCNYGACNPGDTKVCYSPCPVLRTCVNGFMEPCREQESPYELACRDIDGDGFSQAAHAPVSDCVEYCAVDGVPAGYFRSDPNASEPPECDNDAARNPLAAAVCGEDANCDGLMDDAPGWDCHDRADFISEREPSGEVPTACGPQAAVRSCNWDTGCVIALSLPTRFSWLATDDALRHSCGYSEGNTWLVPWDQDENCLAQWGPYLNGIQPGTYRVGFLIETLGDVNVGYQVAINSGDVIRRAEREVFKEDGRTCLELRNVPLQSCQDIEFRIRYKDSNWAHHSQHTLRILSTSVSPEGTIGSSCF